MRVGLLRDAPNVWLPASREMGERRGHRVDLVVWLPRRAPKACILLDKLRHPGHIDQPLDNLHKHNGRV